MHTFVDLEAALTRAGLEWTVAATVESFLRKNIPASFSVPAHLSATKLVAKLQGDFPHYHFDLDGRTVIIRIPQSTSEDTELIRASIYAALQEAGFIAEVANHAAYIYQETHETTMEITQNFSWKEILTSVTAALPGMDVRTNRRGTRIWLTIG